MGDVVYITKEEYERQLRMGQEERVGELQNLAPFYELINKDPKEFTRKDVVNAFQKAFELVGGPIALAVWAMENRTDFYKLYARLLPSQASSALGESNELIVKHVLPKSELDT